jgi:hypothetical protein
MEIAAADILEISKSSVENHLHKTGYVSRLDTWVSHELSKTTLTRRIVILCSNMRKKILFEENNNWR